MLQFEDYDKDGVNIINPQITDIGIAIKHAHEQDGQHFLPRISPSNEAAK